MAHVRVHLPFHVPGLFVARELLGTAFTVERDGYRMTLRLPNEESSFLRWQPLPHGFYRAIRTPLDPEAPMPDFLAVLIVEVECEVEVPGVPDEQQLLCDGLEDADVLAALQGAIDPTRPLARELVRELLEWARSYGQHWLGLGSDAIDAAGPATVVGVRMGERIRTQPTWEALRLSAIRGSEAIAPGHFAEIVTHIEAGVEPPLPEAKYLAWGRQPPDPARAVLMAAIACETKVKSDLRNRATAETRPMIEYVLGNQREVTVTAVDALFHKFMLACQGRSLSDDNNTLFTELKALSRHATSWPTTAFHLQPRPPSDTCTPPIPRSRGSIADRPRSQPGWGVADCNESTAE